MFLGLSTLGLVTSLVGCGGSASGTLTVALQAEDTISGGLSAGAAEEDVVDGWNVTYDAFITAFGAVHLTPAAGGPRVEMTPNLVIDLRTLPETGRVVHMGSVAEGRYGFSYTMPVATAELTRDASVSQADFDRMVTDGCSYLLRGSAENGTRTVAFDFCLDAEASFDCSTPDGMEGIVVSAGASTAFLTVHGDHMFFNGFPAGDEGAVVRRAGWLALVDDATGADGLVDGDDLEATPISILPSTEYVLTGAPTVEGAPVTNMQLYVRAQLSTQGHLDGEGECLSNGVGHMHLDRAL